MFSRTWIEIIRRRSAPADRARLPASTAVNCARPSARPHRGPSAIDLVADGLLGVVGNPRPR